jgi:hypothetical protein
MLSMLLSHYMGEAYELVLLAELCGDTQQFYKNFGVTQETIRKY